MTKVLEGVRILEVAEHTFVPAASALLSDLGAEVIKVEHVTRGDAMRGLVSTGVGVVSEDVHALLEHANRGRKSLGLDLTTPDGIDTLYELAATSDVLLTNKLPSVREGLGIDVDRTRASNPRIIYVRSTARGERAPDADEGSYDSLAFWARASEFDDHGDEILADPGLDWDSIIDLDARGVVA
jgi:crotonobetainyl-CoA:carnitine CoA-transferase CaiB-like acyl-CoA transferase